MKRINLFMKDEIITRLQDLEGEYVALTDLWYKLFEYENCNGSFECSSFAARKWIKDYFEELAEVVESYISEYGDLPNPILEPEKFQMIMILHLSGEMLNAAIYNADLVEDSEVELTAEIIDKIIEEL